MLNYMGQRYTKILYIKYHSSFTFKCITCFYTFFPALASYSLTASSPNNSQYNFLRIEI